RSWKPMLLSGTYKEKGKPIRVRTAKGRYITRERTIEHTLRPSAINGLTAIASGTHTVVFAASDRGLLRSTDGGSKWTFVTAGLLTPFRKVFASPANDGRLVALSKLNLYFSNDFGDVESGPVSVRNITNKRHCGTPSKLIFPSASGHVSGSLFFQR